MQARKNFAELVVCQVMLWEVILLFSLCQFVPHVFFELLPREPLSQALGAGQLGVAGMAGAPWVPVGCCEAWPRLGASPKGDILARKRVGLDWQTDTGKALQSE